MQEKRIYLSSPTMHGEELEYIKEAFETNWIAPLGPNVDLFEKEMEDYFKGAADLQENPIYAAALSSGTAAIHLALINEGIGPGDIVFCSDLTFSATCNPILYQGAIPVFIDSERDTWNMCPFALENAFQSYPNVKAVIVVNLYGTPAKLDEVSAICEKYQVPLIEDAAESLGAKYKGRITGTYGKQGILSFNGNKIITTSGGGMLLSSQEEKIKKARFLATQAREPKRHYEHKEVGYNYRMSNVVAGIGRGQLKYLEEHIKQKKKIYETYKKELSVISDITMNPIPEECEANYWLSCMMLSEHSKVKPLDIMLELEKENIEARPIWKPMHMQPIFRKYPFVTECEIWNGLPDEKDEGNILSVAQDIFNQGLCLPSDIKNKEEDMERIINIIRKLFEVQ